MKRGPTKFYSVYCTTMPFRFLARIACSRCIDAGCCCACFIRSAVCVSWSQWVSAMPSKTAHGRSRCRFRCRLVYQIGCALAPPGKYDRTVQARQRCAVRRRHHCGILVNTFRRTSERPEAASHIFSRRALVRRPVRLIATVTNRANLKCSSQRVTRGRVPWSLPYAMCGRRRFAPLKPTPLCAPALMATHLWRRLRRRSLMTYDVILTSSSGE